MSKSLIWFICASFLLCSPVAYGQKIRVSDPRLEMRGNTIHITYDILNSNQSDEFSVELVVKDADGNKIHAVALTGDVGDRVTGGAGKHIAWDLEADRIEMNADIYVKVYVKAIPPPETVVVVPPVVEEATEGEDEPPVSQQETVRKDPDRDNMDQEEPSTSSGVIQFNRTGLIFQSVVFPGLGLTRYSGNPHWIRGVLGYGCVAGSIIMNQAAIDTYEGIIDQAGFDRKNELYQKALKQDQISEALAYTAIAIWVSDLVWTIAGTSNLNKRTSHHRGPRINSTIDPVSHAPLLAFTYQF